MSSQPQFNLLQIRRRPFESECVVLFDFRGGHPHGLQIGKQRLQTAKHLKAAQVDIRPEENRQVMLTGLGQLLAVVKLGPCAVQTSQIFPQGRNIHGLPPNQEAVLG